MKQRSKLNARTIAIKYDNTQYVNASRVQNVEKSSEFCNECTIAHRYDMVDSYIAAQYLQPNLLFLIIKLLVHFNGSVCS